jgi:transcriptional regulator with XRE-family HTH domain
VLTPDQIRAARALKNWSQSELARRVSMATPSIGNIEAGKHSPSLTTQEAIREAFDKAGIEFIENGVRHKNDLIQVYEGPDCYLRLLDDMFLALSPEKGEVLFSESDESRSSPEVVEKLRAMRSAGISMRSLICDGDTFMMGPLEEYRWMPKNMFVDRDVKVIFDDRVAHLISWHDIPKVIVIREYHIADEARRSFDYIWSHSAQPDSSSAPARYN